MHSELCNTSIAARRGGLPIPRIGCLPELPTGIHNILPNRHIVRGTLQKITALRIQLLRTRGCYAIIVKAQPEPAAQAISGRYDLCGRGTRRQRRPFERVFTLCGAAGRPAHQSRRGRTGAKTRICGFHHGASPAVPWPPEHGPRRRRAPRQTPRGGPKENFYKSRNPSAQRSLMGRRRAKPPSPSPSITRRRTPAALAVGVLLFAASAGKGRFRSTIFHESPGCKGRLSEISNRDPGPGLNRAPRGRRDGSFRRGR